MPDPPNHHPRPAQSQPFHQQSGLDQLLKNAGKSLPPRKKPTRPVFTAAASLPPTHCPRHRHCGGACPGWRRHHRPPTLEAAVKSIIARHGRFNLPPTPNGPQRPATPSSAAIQTLGRQAMKYGALPVNANRAI